MQTMKFEQDFDLSSNKALNRSDCMFPEDTSVFNQVNKSCFFSSSLFPEVLSCQKQNFANTQTSLFQGDVFSLKTSDDAIGENSRVNDDIGLTPEVVIPVNLMRLLQDTNADEDDIMNYLISRKPEKASGKVKGPRPSKKNHPANSGVKCEVCGGKAVGFHYGADVCTGCRLFFYRHHQTDPDHNCETKSRRACSACRLWRCRQAGMSIKACKRGRYSYEKMYEYSVRVSGSGVTEARHLPGGRQLGIPSDPRPVPDEIIVVAARISEAFVTGTSYPPNYFENIPHRAKEYVHDMIPRQQCNIQVESGTSSLLVECESEYARMHFDRYTQAGLCMQNLQRFVEQLPGYNKIPQQDRWDFFTRHMLPIHVISEYRAYDVQRGLEFHLRGTVSSRREMQQHIGSDYTDQLFGVVDKLQKLNLNENERNLLKLAGFFETDPDMSQEGNVVASKEQDVMIRAFDHVVRANRKDSYQATVVIGAAMQILADIHVLLEISGKDIAKNVHRYPAQVRTWVGKTFVGSKPYIKQENPVNVVH